MSPNEFIESAHTIGWKILLGIVYMANVITFRWSQFQSASSKPFKFCIFIGMSDCYRYPFDKKTGSQQWANQVLKQRTNVGN